MKILHIISSSGMYGAEAVILNLSRTLNEGGHRSMVGVFANASNPNLQLHQSDISEGIESHLIPCKGQLDRVVLSGIRELVASTQADVVHAHGYKADVYAYLALRGAHMPMVSTCHNWLDNDPLVYLYGVIDRLVLRRYAAVVAVSDEVKQRLLHSGVRAAKVHQIRNGIDLRPFERAAPTLREEMHLGQVPIVGLVGRLAKEKGVDIFLRAAAQVLRDFPSAQFVVVGDGPDREQLDGLVSELKLREHVSLLGRRDDMPSVYASLDVMVSASRQEGLPMAILEGMASSKPMVATAVGDVPAVVLDGRTGVLVPAENVPLLAAAIARLLHDAALREQLGSAARELIQQEFSAGRMAAEYLRVYQQVAAQHESTRQVDTFAISEEKMK